MSKTFFSPDSDFKEELLFGCLRIFIA